MIYLLFTFSLLLRSSAFYSPGIPCSFGCPLRSLEPGYKVIPSIWSGPETIRCSFTGAYEPIPLDLTASNRAPLDPTDARAPDAAVHAVVTCLYSRSDGRLLPVLPPPSESRSFSAAECPPIAAGGCFDSTQDYPMNFRERPGWVGWSPPVDKEQPRRLREEAAERQKARQRYDMVQTAQVSPLGLEEDGEEDIWA